MLFSTENDQFYRLSVSVLYTNLDINSECFEANENGCDVGSIGF